MPGLGEQRARDFEKDFAEEGNQELKQELRQRESLSGAEGGGNSEWSQ